MEVGVVLELSAPGMQDTGKTRESWTDETLVLSQPFACLRRGGEQGLVSDALMRADKRAQGLRDGEGEEAVRSGKLCLQVGVEPLLGFMLLTLRAVTIATGMRDAVGPPTALALREALSVVSAAAMADGADDLAVRGGEGGRTLQGLWRKGGEDIAEGGHGRSPCMRE